MMSKRNTDTNTNQETGDNMIDFERTSIGRAAHRMKLKDALFTLVDNDIENMDTTSNRTATRKEIELLQAMMRVNKYIRSNPNNNGDKV